MMLPHDRNTIEEILGRDRRRKEFIINLAVSTLIFTNGIIFGLVLARLFG
jgi:hypothetical protein